MKEKDKTREQLISELAEMRQRVAELETADTECKRAEEALQRSEAHYRELADSITDIFFAFDRDLRYTYWNRASEELTGITAKDAIGKSLYDLFPDTPQTRQAEEVYRDVLRTQQPQTFVNEYQLGGKNFLFEISAYPSRDGLSVFVKDITERKRAEEELIRLSNAVKMSTDIIVIGDLEAKIIDVNEATLKMYGTDDKGDLVGKNPFDLIAPEDRGKAFAGMEETLERGYTEGREYHILTKDGSKIPVEMNSALMKDADGNPIGFVSISRDITERKRAEEEIKQRNRELAALNAITASIMESTLDLDEVLQRTADGVVEGLGCNTAFIFLLDEEEGIFKGGAVCTKDKILQRMNAIIGFPLLQIKIPARRDFNEAVSNLLDGRPTIKHDFYELVRPLWSKPVAYAMQRLLDSRTFFTMPLIAKGKTVGGIVASTREELGEGETEKLMTFANQAAIAIENARLYEEAQQEITERRRVEKELGESEVRYRALVESSYDHIFMLDRSGTYLASNNQVGQFGLENGESLVGCHLRDVYPPDLAEFYQRQLEQVLTTGQAVYFEHHMPELNGHRYHLDTLYPIRSDGEVWALGGICRDITERRQAQEELRQSLEKLQTTLEGTVNSLASAIEMRDPYTAGHQRRVTQLACAIAEEMGLPKEQINGLRVAGLIHDIGKINVPAEILSKPSRLTELEFSLIKMHPQVGYDILKEIEFPWPVAEIVLQHHERMDGSGYPRGLSDEDILPEARVLSVADVVEAMASHRPYRPSRGIDLALEEISQNRGVLYDPEVVDVCLKLFTKKGFKFK